ncbi:hypothetical protein [Nocardioides soli]|uniref:Uncharacterized protein n=1 Tax=Nocardioides soli TaxID=1036020 RepID=A0A7W4Z106_9ACTN|nr:hypothetical protein [Nocardioides soli]MBB3042859.1 hypothetical protein [Nocardioides soli]
MSNDFTVDSLMPTAEVQRWLASAKLDNQPEIEQTSRVRLLADFCNARGESPTDMIARVLRGGEEDGQYEIAIKGRRELDAAIDAWGDDLGVTLHQNITAGNVLRSFFIHNGVQMQGRPSL